MSDLFDPTNAPQLDETKDYLTELVGDGKKFKDVKDLAKGKAFSDLHIQTLEKTLNQMREELQTRKTAEELINQIALTKPNANPDRTGDNLPPDADAGKIKSGLTPEDVEKLFAEREGKQRRENNLATVSTKLTELYGDNAQSAVQAKAKELGLSGDYLRSMAQEAPNAFLALLQKGPQTQKDMFSAPPANSFRTDSRVDTNPKYSDFNKVKTSDPKTYWSPAFQRKLMAAGEKAMAEDRYEQFLNS